LGRKKLLTDEQIREAKQRVDRKEISLRKMAMELGVSHVALNLRFKEIGEKLTEINILDVNGKQKKLTIMDKKLTTKENQKIKLRTELPFRKMPTAKEFSGHDYFKLDIEMLRTWYRLVTGRQDKSKGGKASNIESLIPAIIEGLQYNLEYYMRGD